MATTNIRSEQIKDKTVLVDDLRDFAPSDGGGLNLTVAAGRIGKRLGDATDKAEQTVALTDNATNFVEVRAANGVALANTTAFTVLRASIAVVITSGGTISSIVDKRSWISWPGTRAVSGSDTFNSTTGRVITHDFDFLDHRTTITSTQDPGGSLGEVWVIKGTNTDTIFNSGAAITSFDWLVRAKV